MTEPQTEAGRRFINGDDMKAATVETAVLAIEAEATAAAEQRLRADIAEQVRELRWSPGSWAYQSPGVATMDMGHRDPEPEDMRRAVLAILSGGSPAQPGATGATANETPPTGYPAPAASPRQGEPVAGDVEVLDAVYVERNRLVAALAHLFGNAAWRGLDPGAPDFTVVYVDLPSGQVSWHIPDAEMEAFPPLPLRDPTGWDGHDTDEKYRRLAALRRGDICRDVAEAVQRAVNHERAPLSPDPAEPVAPDKEGNG